MAYHQRRASGRCTSNSFSPASPRIESPRTLCPKDGDAFSYNPSHLPVWYMAQDLWNSVPKQMQSALAALQHSGAAVLTGYERLDRLDSSPQEPTLESRPLPEQLSLSDLRATSFGSSVLTSPSSHSPTSSMSSSPALSAFPNTGPISPIALSTSDLSSVTPSDVTPSHKRHHGRSFSIPLEPDAAYYATELSYLRTESLPRLRHAVRKVDTEWYEAKRLGSVSESDVSEFEKWWAEKKNWIRQLDERGRRLSVAMGVSPAGMGWTAP
ncbi:hypothetical protein GQ43DRAFT_364981 [Delitschia confertaspora ATCC 74209]|uniref:Uncharacterized protein n=1 Tax=Delitschia confertaspora ATCC 74209 TaxID=1513339 RepID=A0A9P4MV33_9PLEO|nr:hypothetical protein GQ43DRAFT_364981 [Delitschia confertaspora ATCC 74209]